MSPLSDRLRTLRVASFQILQSVPQASRIQLADRENSETALRAPGTTNNPGAASSSGIRQRRVHDLD